MSTITEQAAALRAQDPLAELSARERHVFDLVALGLPPTRIAERLGLSIKTISTYRARLYKKLNVRSTAEIVRIHIGEALVVSADHALFAAALTAGVAAWKPFDLPGVGEIVVDGLRYATHIDMAGVPELHELLRCKLKTALERSKMERAA